jgi:hypothetical protein
MSKSICTSSWVVGIGLRGPIVSRLDGEVKISGEGFDSSGEGGYIEGMI